MADWPTDQRGANTLPGTQPPVRAEAEVRDRDIRRLQGLQMLLERVAGASLPDLAAKYRLTNRLADERMTEAWKEGVLKGLEGELYEQLGPLAMAVYEAQLKMGSLDAARDILGTMGVIRRPGQTIKVQPVLPKDLPEVAINSIEDYRLARQSRSYAGGASPAATRNRMITPGGTDVPQ
jgi:hypothetical protein